ncbi:hypothetical protein BC940DRAFT_30379 [Gongronella butleri]|nr:hypothetical protein BC940DRAFT_30379 [Gongronella butleri]
MAQKRSLMKKQSATTKREEQDGRRDAQQQRILGPQAKRVQKTSKKTRLLDILGANVTCARVGRLNRVLRVNLPDDQASRLVAVIRDVCLYATRMRFLQMAFTKYFILVCHDAHLPLHPYIFDPHFYHAVQQLFLGKAITNAAVIAHHSTTILRVFLQFRQQYPALQISRLGGIHGTREYATTLNHLNKQTATGHINFVVETFHTRLMHCLAAQLHGHLSNLKHGHALAYARHLIVEQCKLAEEHPAPNVDYINEERVQHAVEQVRQGLRIDLETIWSVYALEKTEGEHEAWDAWANARSLGEDATLAILQGIAQEARETIPPVGRIDMAFITRKPHLFLHYLLMVDEYAEEHNDFIQRQSTKMLFEADRPFAFQQLNQLRLQLTRPQRRRLARAIVSAINAEPPYHPPHDDHLHDDDDDTDEAHGAAIARRQAFDPQPWRHLGTNALHKLSTVVAQARKRLYWSNKVRQWGNTSDRSMLARCLYGKASPATRQLRVFGPSPTPSFVRIHITLDDESLSTLLTSAGIPIRPKQGCFNRVFAPAALVSAHALSSNPPRMAPRSVCHTDGHRISLLYAKSKAPLPQLPLLDLSDFQPWELAYFQIWGLDPGQRDLIVAADGAQPSMYEYPLMAQDNMLNGRYFAPVMHVPRDAPVPSVKSPHQVRQLSSMEYRVAQHQQQTKMETWKRKSGIKLVESQMPSPRTTQLDKLHDYLVYINTHLDDLLRHYSLKYNKARFEIRRATQKMDAEAVNILIHGGKKYQTQDPRTITSEENLSR